MRSRQIWTAVAAFVAFGGAVAGAAERIEVPIKQTQVLPTLLHYSVPVSIAGGPPIDVMLDSGSTGLRLLPAVMPASGLKKTSTETAYAYGIGLKITGKVWEGKVSVGAAQTDANIRIHAIDAIGCVPDKPQCPGSKTTIDRFLIGGRANPERGYQAIMGVGLAPNGVGNPLEAIGDGVWIITLPKPGASNPGTLVLNPTADERAGYKMFQLARKDLNTPFGLLRGWEQHFPGCVVNTNTKRSFCALSLLDTGAPGLLAHSKNQADVAGWTGGTTAVLAFAVKDELITSDAFVINQQPGAGFTVGARDGPFETELKMGTLPYYSFSVLYDSKAGMIGLKKRTD